MNNSNNETKTTKKNLKYQTNNQIATQLNTQLYLLYSNSKLLSVIINQAVIILFLFLLWKQQTHEGLANILPRLRGGIGGFRRSKVDKSDSV